MAHASVAVICAILCLLTPDLVGTATLCSNPPAGVHKMVRGVDITRLDLIPLEFTAGDGFKNPILNFTCIEGKTWRSPKGNDYQLPDQIWQLTPLPGGWLSATVNIYKSYQEVRSSMAKDVGVEATIKAFSFSASASFKKMQNTIVNSSRYISDVGSFESATRADVIPGSALGLDRFALAMLNSQISGTFQANPQGYNNFIGSFGTHYFSTAYFGGYIRVIMETNKDYFYSRSDSEAQKNAKASYLKIISLSGAQVSSSTSVDESFSNSSIQTVRYYGGNSNLLTENGISQWQPTVESNPWLFSGELKPITDLIEDETKKAEMQKAVLNYVFKNYLDELLRLVASAKSKTNDPYLNNLQTRITALLSRVIVDQGEVEALWSEVENNVVVPDWFISKTNLCFKWRADGNGGQCGGGAANLLCAKPNSMTSVYRDDTDSRAGGCRMQWGIQSSGFPSWFNEVKVCYQWFADGNSGQCGDGAAQLLCASINQFTPEYRDDTDSRSGGCRMSWKLEVPTTAPWWLKTALMCFSWNPDGNSGQCGPAPSRDLCAVANSWTAYYRDDTDNRSGGCRMKWGLKLLI